MMRHRSLILDTTIRLVFDAVLVFSVYLLFAGHNQPGGGFVGGLVAAAAVALRYLAGGLSEVRSIFRIRPWTFLSLGLFLAIATAIVPLLFGNPPLTQEAWELELVVLGKLKATTATVFDTGVYLVVVGLMMMAFEGLGENAPGHEPRGSESRR